VSRKAKPQTVKELAAASGYSVDDALLLFWTNNLWTPDSPTSLLADKELRKAQQLLGAPSIKDETKVTFWLEKLKLTREEFSDLLNELNIKLDKNARKLPKNALVRLHRKYPNSNQEVAQIQEIDYESEEKELQIPPPRWPLKNSEVLSVKYISVEQVLEIYRQLSIDYEGSADPVATSGVMDIRLISSAVENPKVAYEKYHTTHLAIATTVFSLIRNHPFPNGNKRTALISMLVMLDENGLTLSSHVTEQQLFRFVYEIAASQLLEHSRGSYSNLWEHEVLAITNWILRNTSTKAEPRVRPLTWRSLRQKFEELGCEITDNGKGEYVIQRSLQNQGFFSRNTLRKYKLKAASDGTEIDKGVIQTIRKNLELDDEHGVTNSRFYSKSPELPSEFIQRYSKLIKRLSKF
jgi:death-on-curing family protein